MLHGRANRGDPIGTQTCSVCGVTGQVLHVSKEASGCTSEGHTQHALQQHSQNLEPSGDVKYSEVRSQKNYSTHTHAHAHAYTPDTYTHAQPHATTQSTCTYPSQIMHTHRYTTPYHTIHYHTTPHTRKPQHTTHTLVDTRTHVNIRTSSGRRTESRDRGERLDRD